MYYLNTPAPRCQALPSANTPSAQSASQPASCLLISSPPRRPLNSAHRITSHPSGRSVPQEVLTYLPTYSPTYLPTHHRPPDSVRFGPVLDSVNFSRLGLVLGLRSWFGLVWFGRVALGRVQVVVRDWNRICKGFHVFCNGVCMFSRGRGLSVQGVRCVRVLEEGMVWWSKG